MGVAVTVPVANEPLPLRVADSVPVLSEAESVETLNAMLTETAPLSVTVPIASVTLHFHTAALVSGAVPDADQVTEVAVAELIVTVPPLTFVHE